jgi:hypothetical protein
MPLIAGSKGGEEAGLDAVAERGFIAGTRMDREGGEREERDLESCRGVYDHREGGPLRI